MNTTRIDALSQRDEKLIQRIQKGDQPIIFSSPGSGQILIANEAASALLGYSTEELLASNILDFLIEEDQELMANRARQFAAGNTPFPAFDIRVARKDKRIISIQCIGLVERWGQGWGYMHFLRDKSLEEKLEKELQATQRLQSLGTLAGGVAHDFNNLLMVIQGTVSLMQMDIDERHPHFDDLKTIENQVKSGSKLTSQLLGYARQGKFEVQVIDLASTVRKTSEAFARTRRDLSVSIELGEEPVWTLADAGGMEQVLLNLLVNAGDAIAYGGELAVRLSEFAPGPEPDSEWTSGQRPVSGQFVCLEIADTGHGMDEETREHAFEPFFTTKGVGKGTGLVLSYAYGIVKRHAGYIEVESRPGEGATFRVYLPTTDAPDEVQDEELTRGRPERANILLVDDEPMILNLGVRLLNRLGYSVISASSGKEALGIYERLRDRIDLVILDMIMPTMSGTDTHAKLIEIDPDVTVLISTGYSLDSHYFDGSGPRPAGFIQKPYNAEQLEHKIAELVEVPD
ncbi:MAG: response regulator [Pseudomonadales bacterium]|nr:response regulator [Pseudomonadales bacterium]